MKYYFQYIAAILSFTLINCGIFAQNSTTTKIDSNNLQKSLKVENIHSPKKAVIMSAILPGLGQVYNKKYWKVPIVYAALGTVAYVFVGNNKNYKMYRDAYAGRVDADTTNDLILPQFSTENLREIKNIYWKNRDLSVMIFAGFWVLNILDAAVDAHLYTFDIGNDLSLKIHPEISPVYNSKTSFSYGLNLSLSF